MSPTFKKALVIYIISVFVIASIFIFLPINIFDGEITYKKGIMQAVENRRLSLHFLFGLEGDITKIPTVKSVTLTSRGITLAILFIFCFPAIISYRFFLKSTSKEDKK